MRLIGVAGYKGSGKTYISGCLKSWCEKHGYLVHMISFDNLKRGATSKKSKHETIQKELTDTLVALFGEVANELEDIRDIQQRPSERQQRQQAEGLEEADCY